MPTDILFEPLKFRNLTIKNRILRSNISGRFDNYDGSGTQTRINWELKFARGGVGAIISSFVPVHIRGRIMPNYATIDRDERTPFWRELGRQVHELDCKYILQLSHGGRQRDVGGIEYPTGLSSTDKEEPLHGFPCERMTPAQIRETVDAFSEGARRAREAGLDGVELHGANGYLITQFLSSAINDRKDEYGGALENRARFVLDIVRGIRQKVGRDFHLQMKISSTEFNNALSSREKPGNVLDDSIQVCRWLEDAGVDAIHVSSGSSFPHPRNPPGDLPMQEIVKTYDSMISSGRHAFRNFVLFRSWPMNQIFHKRWLRARGDLIEGINLPDARAIKRAVNVPVICTGGFQTASFIRETLQKGDCDAVSIARSLVANNELVKIFAAGQDRPAKPCTYCNKCLVNVAENPVGCYEESRFQSREEMVRQILSVYEDAPLSKRVASVPAHLDGPG
jgi:2,4-dienoyl-CoA reductase-like NADH-dependent reductase (Old Yellow Enzyme family)